ncbi:MAG: hypothetical protein K0S32_4116 [Bacteroidetes bacterium]|jgi:hypothetical protein|nr:hypothetical protein [Bacteroidota bacterium]
MNSCKYFIVFLFLIISVFCQAQVGTVRFHLKLKGAYIFIKDKNVKLRVNDTIEKSLISDKKGYTGFLELPEGSFKILFDVEGYKSITRTIKIVRATGRTLKVRMKKE